MPNTIPPFVCNTPPPIDESEGEEDLCESNDNFDQFNGIFIASIVEEFIF